MKKYLCLLFSGILLFLIFKAWFFPGLITGGDFVPYFKSMYSNNSIFLYAWDFKGGIGLGGFVAPLLWIYFSIGIPLTILGKVLGFDWTIIERVYYLFPFLIISLFSSLFLFRKIFPKKNILSLFSCLIFVLNTYILMIISGGQIAGIGMAYAFLPLVFLSFINAMETSKSSFKLSLVFGLLLSLQLLFDIRIAYITLIALFIYWLILNLEKKNKNYLIKSFSFCFLFAGILSLLLHAFWILPTVIYHQNPLQELGSAYSTIGAVQFFSFAKFENTISLLHPNWPENIFGKVYFMRPEFLLLPILAFASLFFVNKTKDLRLKSYVLFFALLALVGAFLAKGANDPFGGIYLWLFGHFPGFMMFRDPTKWYTLIAISYSVLIPFTIWKVFTWLGSLKQLQVIKVPKLFLLIVVVVLLFLIRPAVFGQLTGAFHTVQIPSEYIKLENFLSTQDSFSRTLWIPTVQRFAFYNSQHPTVPAQDLFSLYSNEQLFQKLKLKNTENLLQKFGIKYVIVPYDSQGEIFLNDRKYDSKAYQRLIDEIKTINWLKSINGFGRIAIFEVPNVKGHFWTTSETISVQYKYVSPVEYAVNVYNAQKGDVVVFAENYDKNWEAKNPLFTIQSSKFEGKFNGFVLPASGDYKFNVYYVLQNAVNIGEIVSAATLIISVFIIFLLFLKRK